MIELSFSGPFISGPFVPGNFCSQERINPADLSLDYDYLTTDNGDKVSVISI